VRKTLRKKKYLEREQECLQILDHLQHRNIVKLLASYSHGGDHHFLFPLFTMNLEDFLQCKERFGEFKHDFTFYTALQGLSSALEKVHSLNLNAKDHDVELGRIGYHHDLKPGNVLVDSRTFYLADFGLAKLRPEDNGSRTEWKQGLGDYVGPECMDHDLKPLNVGRSLDIWSFGCMISEIAAYIEGGADGVTRFRKQRFGTGLRPNMKNQYFFSGKSLKPHVIFWFESFKKRSASRVLRNLLEVAGAMLRIDPIERPKAAKVHQNLSFLSVEALFNAVQQALPQHLGAASNQGDTRSSATAIQFEKARLAAWGKVLQLTGHGPLDDAIEIVSNKANDFNHILTTLLEKSNEGIRADETVSPSPVAISICKPFHEELQRLIDRLWHSLPAVYQEKLKQVWLEDSLDKSCEALHDIETNTRSSQYSELNTLAATKQEILRLTNINNQGADLQISEMASLRLNSNALEIESNFSDGISIGRYHDKRVLVERVSYTADMDEMLSSEREMRMNLTAEVFWLFSKLSDIRVLKCLGFMIFTSGAFSQHCAFVWAFPAPSLQLPLQHKNIVPVSFFEVLKTRKKNDLPLGERFQLAYKLVSCVRELSMVRWLHKNINSRNVVFFVEAGSTPALADIFRHPYLVNFRYSRSSEKAHHSVKPDNGLPLQHYQHPDYSPSEDYREIYDYYSIGILLLELGSWTTLDMYLNHNRNLKSNPAAFRLELINKYAPRLDYIMGATYRDVTLACLRGNFGQSSGESGGQTVLTEFYDKVVGPLLKLSAVGI